MFYWCCVGDYGDWGGGRYYSPSRGCTELGYNYSITQTHSSHDASWLNTDPVFRETSQWGITIDFFNLGTLLNRRESISLAFTTPWSRCRKLGCASFSALISVFRYQIKHTFLCLMYTWDRLCNLCNVHDGMQVILVHRRGGEGALYTG